MDYQNNVSEERVAEMIWDAVSEGATLKDVHGIPQDMMDGLYAHAYEFYNRGRLDEAETFFRFLCIYDFTIRLHHGTGGGMPTEKQFQKACDLYAVAFTLLKNDYRPFFTGQCQLLMRKAAKARQCFELVNERTEDESLRAKALVYLEALKTAETEQHSEQEKE